MSYTNGKKPPLIPQGAHDNMVGATNSAEGVLAKFLIPISPKIDGGPTRESLIEIYLLICGNVASMASNLGGGRHGHLELKMNVKDYLAQIGHPFVPTHNPGG